MSENKIPTERETLIDRANLMGLDFKGNISTDKLRTLVNGEIKPEIEDAPEPVKPVKGTMTQAQFDQKQLIAKRRQMSRLRRVVISCNDPQMKDWDTTPYMHISNALISLPKIVVPLNVDWHVQQAYIDLLKGQTCGIPVKAKDEKGRPITKRKSIKKYNIAFLDDLTNDELDELKAAQISRDGVK